MRIRCGLSRLRLVSNYMVHFVRDRLEKTPNFHKDMNIFDQLRNYQLLKKCYTNV